MYDFVSEVNAKMDAKMDEIMEDEIPMDLIEAANNASYETLPATSKKIYLKTYNQYLQWRTDKGVHQTCEKIMMAYFYELSKNLKPSSLWAYYSMLKTTIRIHQNVDIGKFYQLTGFLKNKSCGYQPLKAKIFSDHHINKFLHEATDDAWLDIKVACIFSVCGALRTDELIKVKIGDIERHGENLIVVQIPTSKTKKAKSFTIGSPFLETVKKYAALRVPTTKDDRFFVNYQKGKCTAQVIGKNKLSLMPRKIAEFLKLEDVKAYSGHSLRRTSSSILANSGASKEEIMAHGGWESAKVAESYIERSITYKKKTGDKITSTITRAVENQEGKAFDELPRELSTAVEEVDQSKGAGVGKKDKFGQQSTVMSTQCRNLFDGVISEMCTNSVTEKNNNNGFDGLGGASKSLNFTGMAGCTFNFNFKNQDKQ